MEIDEEKKDSKLEQQHGFEQDPDLNVAISIQNITKV